MDGAHRLEDQLYRLFILMRVRHATIEMLVNEMAHISLIIW